MAIVDRNAMNNKKRQVQNYYQGMKTKSDLGKIFNDSEQSAKQFDAALKGLIDTSNALINDRNGKTFQKYRGQIEGVSKAAQDMQKRMKDGFAVSEKEMADLQKQFMDLSFQMQGKQSEVFGEVVSKMDDASKQAMENFKKYVQAVEDTNIESPLKTAISDFQQSLQSLSQMNILSTLKGMGQSAGLSNYKSRDQLAMAMGSRDVAYDVLSDFCKQNMDINKQVGRSILGQGQAVALINRLVGQGVNSSTWMKREYEQLVELQETLGANNILTQAIVDNTYALRGGSEQATAYYDQLMTDAHNAGIVVSSEQMQGYIQSAMDTIRKVTLRDATNNGWDSDRTQKEMQDRFDKLLSRGGEAYNNILNGTITQWSSQILAQNDRGIEGASQASLVGGYRPGDSALTYNEAQQRGFQQLLTDNASSNQEMLANVSGMIEAAQQYETQMNTFLQASDMGGGDEYERTDQRLQEKHTTLFEQAGNFLSNLVGSSQSGLEKFDNIELFVQNARDISKAIFGVIADIYTVQKFANVLMTAIEATTAKIAIGQTISNITSAGGLTKVAGTVGKVAGVTALVAGVGMTISAIASTVNDIKNFNARGEQAKEGLTEEDKKAVDEIVKDASDDVSSGTATGAAVGTGVGLGTAGTIAGVGIANGWNPGGWALLGLAGLVAIGTGIGALIGHNKGKESAEEKMETVQGVDATKEIRSRYHGTQLDSVFENGGGATSAVDSSLPLNLNKGIIESSVPPLAKHKGQWSLSQGYGDIVDFSKPNVGGGYFNGTFYNKKAGWSISAGWPRYGKLRANPPLSQVAKEMGITQDELESRIDNGTDRARGGRHRGMDLVVTTGTKVGAAVSGTAYAKSDPDGYGYYVQESGDDGRTYIYAHLSSRKVSTGGTKVDKGTLIGLSGNTGSSTGAHLHFEVRKSPTFGDDVNPYGFFTTAVSNPGKAAGDYEDIDETGSDQGAGDTGSSGTSGGGGWFGAIRSALQTTAAKIAGVRQLGVKFNDTKLAIGGANDANPPSSYVPFYEDKSSDDFTQSSLIIPNVNSNSNRFTNQQVQQSIETRDNTDILNTMTNNFKSLEMVIQKVSAMEMQYQDLKETMRFNKSLPDMSFSD